MLVAVLQCWNHICKGTQTFIDGQGLFKPIPFDLAFVESLRASQVNKTQSLHHVPKFELDLKDGVASATVCIASCAGNLSGLLRFLEELENFVSGSGIDQSRLILAALVVLSHNIWRIQQVLNRVQVYLLEGNHDRLCIGIQGLQNLVDSSRDNATFTFIFLTQAVGAHSVSLATSCLPVGENADVVPV